MKWILGLVFILFSCGAEAVDTLPIGNPQSNGATKFFYNDNGTVKEVLKIDSNGLSGGGYSAKNYALNGDMNINQTGSVTTVDDTSTYGVDQFLVQHDLNGGGKFDLGRVSSTPTPPDDQGYTFKIKTNTTESSLDSNEYALIEQPVEGFDSVPLYGKTYTVSFYVYMSDASRTYPATACFVVKNDAATRSYVGTYTINSNATWEKKTITISQPVWESAWLTGTSKGIRWQWVIAAHTSLHAPALNTWYSTGYVGHSSCTNFLLGNTAYYMALDKVMVNEGTVAAPFQLAGKTYGGELALLQRYYEKSCDLDTAPVSCGNKWWTTAVSAFNGVAAITIPIRVPKRIVPGSSNYGTYLTGTTGLLTCSVGGGAYTNTSWGPVSSSNNSETYAMLTASMTAGASAVCNGDWVVNVRM